MWLRPKSDQSDSLVLAFTSCFLFFSIILSYFPNPNSCPCSTLLTLNVPWSESNNSNLWQSRCPFLSLSNHHPFVFNVAHISTFDWLNLRITFESRWTGLCHAPCIGHSTCRYDHKCHNSICLGYSPNPQFCYILSFPSVYLPLLWIFCLTMFHIDVHHSHIATYTLGTDSKCIKGLVFWLNNVIEFPPVFLLICPACFQTTCWVRSTIETPVQFVFA